MTPTIEVRPAEGLRVLDPATGRPLPAEGAAVPRDGWWLRRLACGDVAEVPPAPTGSDARWQAAEGGEG